MTTHIFKVLWILFTFLSPSTALAATSYPLICQGGPGMSAVAQAAANNGVLGEMITITFTKGDSARNPNPGECVWLDRGFRDLEPNQMVFSKFTLQTQIYHVSNRGINPGEGPLRYLLRAITRSEQFYVHAYRSGNLLMVTRLGP